MIRHWGRYPSGWVHVERTAWVRGRVLPARRGIEAQQADHPPPGVPPTGRQFSLSDQHLQISFFLTWCWPDACMQAAEAMSASFGSLTGALPAFGAEGRFIGAFQTWPRGATKGNS